VLFLESEMQKVVSRAYNITVIICAYTLERWDDLLAAVTSLYKQTRLADEIIVVIDHNPQLFELTQRAFVDIIVVENRTCAGLSGARNTGIALAHGTHLVFLDDDAEAAPDWLERLLSHCEDPQVLGVGGTVIPRWLGSQPRWFPPEFYWVIGCTYQALPQGPVVVRNPYGGCTCIKQEVFQEIGGFREGVGRIGANGMGGEETELSIRAAQHWPDKKFLYEPHANIYHRIPARRAGWQYFLSRCYAEGLSKAIISRYVGMRDGLSSERMYTLRTLPLGVLKNLADVLLHGDLHGFSRAGAILVGLAMTTVGYVKGMLPWRKL
jgi:glucosyl-dolichyl phosphate glucuronosyltransferase